MAGSTAVELAEFLQVVKGYGKLARGPILRIDSPNFSQIQQSI
jgi:hypothetical protein